MQGYYSVVPFYIMLGLNVMVCMAEIHTENKCNTLRQIYVKHEESTDFIVLLYKYYWKSKCWSTSFKAFIIIAFENTTKF